MVQLTAINEATDDELFAVWDQLCLDRMVPGANFKDLADNITQVQDELHERKLICTVGQLLQHGAKARFYVVRDPRQRSTECRDGYFLSSHKFPASWSPHKETAMLLTPSDMREIIKDWVYIEDCVVEQV